MVVASNRRAVSNDFWNRSFSGGCHISGQTSFEGALTGNRDHKTSSEN